MNKTLLPNKIYDFFKILAWILPWVVVLYRGLGEFWAFPMVDSICGSIEVVECVLCGMLGISTAQYNVVIPQQIEKEEMSDAEEN